MSAWEREDAPTYPGELMLERLAEMYGVPGGGRAFEDGSLLAAGEVRERSVASYTTIRPRLTPAVYEVVFGYLERMRKARCSEEQISEAERIMTDTAYSQLYKHSRREKTEEDQIMDIHAAWRFIAEVIQRTEGKKL